VQLGLAQAGHRVVHGDELETADSRNESEMMATAGIPARSKAIPSATVAALQEPQSPTAVTTTSHSATIWSNSSVFTGVPK